MLQKLDLKDDPSEYGSPPALWFLCQELNQNQRDDPGGGGGVVRRGAALEEPLSAAGGQLKVRIVVLESSRGERR